MGADEGHVHDWVERELLLTADGSFVEYGCTGCPATTFESPAQLRGDA